MPKVITFNDFGSSTSAPNYDYSAVDPRDILNDPFFRRDIMDNARAQGMSDATFEEALAEWYNEQSYAYMNEIGAFVGDAGYLSVKGLQGEAKDRMARLTQAYERMPNVLTTEARAGSISDHLSGAEITKTLAGANILNPSNVVGGGAAKQVARGSLLAGESALKAAGKAGMAGAKHQFLAGAGSEAAIDTANQNRDMDLGIQDDHSMLQLGASVAVGAVGNWGISALLGAATTPLARSKILKDNKTLLDRGFSQDEINVAANTSGANGIDALLSFKNHEAYVKAVNPEPKETELTPSVDESEGTSTLGQREQLDIDIDMINNARKAINSRIEDIDNPPTTAERADLDGEARLLQALEDDALDIGRIYSEAEGILGRIKEGATPEESSAARKAAQKLIDEARVKANDYNIRSKIYGSVQQGETYLDALARYKEAKAKAEAARAKQKAKQDQQDAQDQTSSQTGEQNTSAQSSQEPPLTTQTQAQPKQAEAKTAEEQKIIDETADAESKQVPPASEEHPTVATVRQIIEDERAKEQTPQDSQAKADTKPKKKTKAAEFSDRVRAFAAGALENGSEIDFDNLSRKEKNAITRSILELLEPDNAGEWGAEKLGDKITRIERAIDNIAAKIEQPDPIADATAAKVETATTPTKTAEGEAKTAEGEAANQAAEGEAAQGASANQAADEKAKITEAVDTVAAEEFDVPENLVEFANSIPDADVSRALGDLFTSIVQTGTEAVLGDFKVMRRVIVSMFGRKDGKKIYRLYKKMYDEANETDSKPAVKEMASGSDEDFARDFINEYVQARMKRVKGVLKINYSGYWSDKHQRVIINEHLGDWRKRFQADAREILRTQYNVRGASLEHWEMFSNIKKDKKASTAYIKAALRGETKSIERPMDEAVVLTQDMAVAKATNEQVPVAFLTTRSIGSRMVLADGYPKGTYKNGRSYIPAGQIVYYSPYDKKFYQSVKDLLQSSGRATENHRDQIDITSYIDVSDFRDRKKILGTGLHKILSDYLVVHTHKTKKDAETGVRESVQVKPYQKRGNIVNFLVSRYLLEQEISSRAAGTFFELTPPAKTADATTPKPKDPKPKAELQKVEEPTIQDGYRLAILSPDGQTIRVITDAQIDNGQGLAHILGNSPAEKWQVGTVPDNAPKVNAANREMVVGLFEPLSDQPRTTLFSDFVPKFADLHNFNARDYLSANEITEITNLAVDAGALNKFDIRGWSPTIADVVHLLDATEVNLIVPAKQADFPKLIEQAKYINEIRARLVPNGVMRDNLSRKKAVTAARYMLAGYSPSIRNTAKDLLEALGQAQYDAIDKIISGISGMAGASAREGAPMFAQHTRKSNGAHGFGTDGSSVISVASNQNLIPPVATMLHEIGHWAYINVMTPKMRMEFWNEIESMLYVNGKLDDSRIGDIGGFNKESIGADRSAMLQMTAENLDSNELFANMFTKWAMNNRHSDMFEANSSYWAKVTVFIKDLLHSLSGYNKGISPQTEALFNRLYPEGTAVSRQAKKTIAVYDPANLPPHLIKTESTAAGVVRTRIAELNAVWEKFNGHLSVSGRPINTSSEDIIMDARNLSRTLNSLAMTRSESRILASYGLTTDPVLGEAGKNKTGQLKILNREKGLTRNMRKLAKDVNAIYVKYLSGAAGELAIPEEAFDIVEFENILDAIEDGIELTPSQRDLLDNAAAIAGVKPDDIRGIEAYIETTGAEIDFDEGLALQVHQADAMDVVAAAKEISELIDENKALIERAAEILGDSYYQSTGNAIRLPSDKVIREVDLGGKAPMSKKRKQIIIGQNARKKKAAKATGKVKKKFASMTSRQLGDAYNQALDSGDTEMINDLHVEAYRRSETDSIYSLSGPNVIRDGATMEAITKEMASVTTEDGINIDAPIAIRDGQRMLTHRNADVQADMRKFFYRMYNLIHANTRDKLDDVPLLNAAQLEEVVGGKKEFYAVMVDASQKSFSGLRTDLRRVIVGLNTDKGTSPQILMHEIGHILRRSLGQDDMVAIRKGFEQAKASGDKVAVDFAERRYSGRHGESKAEEWFVESWANYLANRVSKEDITGSLDYIEGDGFDSQSIQLKSTIDQLLDNLSERAMYVLNGMIGRNDVKQMFRRLTFAGDLSPKTHGVFNKLHARYISPDALHEYAASIVRDMPEDGVENLVNFTRGSITDSTDGRVGTMYFSTSRPMVDSKPHAGNGQSRLFGDAISLHRDADTANTLFNESQGMPKNMRNSLVNAARRAAVRSGADEGDYVESALTQFNGLERYREILSELIKESFTLENHMAFQAGDSLAKARGRLLEIKQLIDEIRLSVKIEEADLYNKFDFTVPAHNAVVVTNIKPSEVVDLTDRGDLNSQISMLMKIVNESDIAPITARSINERLGKADSINAALSNIEHNFPKGLTTHLAGLGYKAAKVGHTNKEDRIVSFAIFDSANLKRIDDEAFTSPKESIMPVETETLQALTGEVIKSMAHTPETKVTPADIATLVATMSETNGNPSGYNDILSKITRGYVGSGDESKNFAKKVQKLFSTGLAENSVQIRRAGMSWLADKIKPVDGVGFYEKHGSKTGQKIQPVLSLLHRINSGEKGVGKRYLDRVNQWGYKPTASEARVLKALRRPDGSAAEKRLQGDEIALYKHLREQFRADLATMRQQGLFVGEIKHYLPQVWDVNMIGKHRAEFIPKLAAYFRAEARERGEDLAEDLAVKRAERMVNRLTDDDGVYIPSNPHNQVGSNTDHLDFSRIIRLDEPFAKKNLQELEGYLVNDLGALTTKYFNESTRRIQLTDDYGVNSHAFYDYASVHEGGLKAAAKLLSSGKVYRRTMQSFDGEVMFELQHQMMMPIARDEVHGLDIANTVNDIIKSEGKEAAKQHLLGLAMKSQPALIKRVDAIVNALAETGGETAASVTDYKHAMATFDAVRGRSPFRGGVYHEASRVASKNLRMFNSVSLLSYTVITSMTDLVLPVIRNGNLTTAIKGLGKLSADPDYRDAIRNVGAGMSSIAHQKIVYMTGTEGDKLSNAFFAGIGLNQWTEVMRDYAAAAAYETLKAEQRVAIRSVKGDGTNLSIQSGEYRRAKRFLARVGLSHLAEGGAESLEGSAALNNPQVREALHKMVNESVFAPNANDIPLVWQSPLGALLFQFKSFPLMMGRLARMALWDNTIGAYKKGEAMNFAPAAFLLLMAPMVGDQVLGLRETITAKGGEEGGEYKRRERSGNKFLETLGRDENSPVFDDNELDALAGRYLEGLMFAGGFGLLADLFHQSAEQIDNGAYGSTRIASTFLGPSYGLTFGTGVNIVSGALDDNDESNAKERQAWREIISRIPVLGQNRQLKESGVDWLGGEASR